MTITNQELLDRTWDRFVVQDLPRGVRKDEAFGDTCVYRAPDGAKCAIGHEMSDEEYDRIVQEGCEEKIMTSLPNWFQDKFESTGFAASIQDAHDNALDVDLFRSRLLVLAREHGLELPA